MVDILEKGTIIIDTSSLAPLVREVPEKYKLNKDAFTHWSDSLVILGSLGYHIIIPEMIAFESARMLADGRCMEDFLPLRPGLDQRDAQLHNARGDIRIFLKKVIAGDYLNITVQPVIPNGSKVANFLHDVTKAVDNFKDIGDNAEKLEEVRSNLIAVLSRPPRQSLIDKAANPIVEHTKGAIYYLSEDEVAGNRLQAAFIDKQICKVNTKGYLLALAHSGIFTLAGINLNRRHGRSTLNRLGDDIRKINDDKFPEPRTPPINYIRQSSEFIDFSLPASHGAAADSIFSLKDALQSQYEQIKAMSNAIKRERHKNHNQSWVAMVTGNSSKRDIQH